MARHDDITVFYDNFNYLQRSRHQVLGDHGKMYNYTTAKLVQAGESRIPLGGLRQDMIHNEMDFHADDILSSVDFKHDGIWETIQRFIIVRAIKHVYPHCVSKIYAEAKVSEPSMPILDVLPPIRTKHITMGAILEDESSVSGNYNVLDNIFAQQLGLSEQSDKYSQRLYLIYGDQKTCKLIRSCKHQRGFGTSSTYHQLKWALPAPGLWHLRLNYLQMVLGSFYGGRKHSDQLSTLYPQINMLNRHNIPKKSAPFHHMEELILHSLDARIIGMLYIKIGGQCNIQSADNVSAYLAGLSLPEFQSLIDAIFEELFARKTRANYSDICHEAAENSIPALDMEFVNNLRYIEIVEPYVVLKHAIKHADIGLLKRAVARCCVIFHGSTSKNYARELLHLYRLTATKAADPILQRAILSCGLVNLRGKANTFFEADRLVELLNLQLKELMWTRGNSTFDVDHLFQWGLSITNYYLPLRGAFELSFGIWTNSEHTAKSARGDIHSLADLLSQDSLCRRKYRPVQFSAPELVYRGFQRLLDGAVVRAFNADLKQTGDTAYDVDDDDGVGDDEVVGYQATDEIVSIINKY
jgi:hypothetical protein